MCPPFASLLVSAPFLWPRSVSFTFVSQIRRLHCWCPPFSAGHGASLRETNEETCCVARGKGRTPPVQAPNLLLFGHCVRLVSLLFPFLSGLVLSPFLLFTVSACLPSVSFCFAEVGTAQQEGRQADTVTNKKGGKTGDKKENKRRQKGDKADTMTNKNPLHVSPSPPCRLQSLTALSAFRLQSFTFSQLLYPPLPCNPEQYICLPALTAVSALAFQSFALVSQL